MQDQRHENRDRPASDAELPQERQEARETNLELEQAFEGETEPAEPSAVTPLRVPD